MKFKIVRLFIVSAGFLLLIAAIAKLISSVGGARVLQTLDPVLGVTFRHVLWIVGALEIVVALFSLFGERIGIQVGLVAWLATSFVAYRLGLLWVGYHKPCSCLGNLTDALHITPETADTAMKIILAYLSIGSYATLFWLWRQKRRSFTPT